MDISRTHQFELAFISKTKIKGRRLRNSLKKGRIKKIFSIDPGGLASAYQ